MTDKADKTVGSADPTSRGIDFPMITEGTSAKQKGLRSFRQDGSCLMPRKCNQTLASRRTERYDIPVEFD
jgi:hypothetical protein